MSSSSSKPSGPRVKHCQHISLLNAVTQAPPPPRSDLPVTINDIPTSVVTKKTDPLPPPPYAVPPKKKRTSAPHSPFFDGVYGRPLFSLAPVRHFSSIPKGKSIIFNYFRKAMPHEATEGSSYILIDIFENLWAAPEVFLKWRQAVDTGNMKEPEKTAFHYCLTRIGDKFRLYCSPRKDSLQSVKHPLPLHIHLSLKLTTMITKKKKKRRSLWTMIAMMKTIPIFNQNNCGTNNILLSC